MKKKAKKSVRSYRELKSEKSEFVRELYTIAKNHRSEQSVLILKKYKLLGDLAVILLEGENSKKQCKELIKILQEKIR